MAPGGMERVSESAQSQLKKSKFKVLWYVNTQEILGLRAYTQRINLSLSSKVFVSIGKRVLFCFVFKQVSGRENENYY